MTVEVQRAAYETNVQVGRKVSSVQRPLLPISNSYPQSTTLPTTTRNFKMKVILLLSALAASAYAQYWVSSSFPLVST